MKQQAERTVSHPDKQQPSQSSLQPRDLPPKPEYTFMNPVVPGPQQKGWFAERRPEQTDISTTQPRSWEKESREGLPRENAGQTAPFVPQQKIQRKVGDGRFGQEKIVGRSEDVSAPQVKIPGKSEQGVLLQGSTPFVQSGKQWNQPQQLGPSIQNPSDVNPSLPHNQQVVNVEQNREDPARRSMVDSERRSSSQPDSQLVAEKDNSNLTMAGTFFHQSVPSRQQSSYSNDGGNSSQQEFQQSSQNFGQIPRSGDGDTLKRYERSTLKEARGVEAKAQDQQHAAEMYVVVLLACEISEICSEL